jgi:hypothetical protein
MKTALLALKSPAISGFLLLFPFLILELVNRRNFHEGFPILLLSILWLLAVIFLVTLMPLVRNVRVGNNIFTNPVSILFRVVFLVILARMWTGVLIDQMPCFLGVPNCD